MSSPRIALLMVAHTPRADKGGSMSHEEVLKHWNMHVVDPLLADVEGSALHTFLCFQPSGGGSIASGNASSMELLTEHRKHVAQLWARLSGTWQVVVAMSGTVAGSTQPTLRDYPDQFSRWDGCLRAMHAHEKRNQPFTHVIKARPDLLFWSRIPPIAQLDPVSVSLRARALIHASPKQVAWLSLSSRFGCEPEVFLMSDHIREATSACGASTSSREAHQRLAGGSCKRAAVEQVRLRLRRASIEACVVVDDQFAMMPRHVADAFLELEPSGAYMYMPYMAYTCACTCRDAGLHVHGVPRAGAIRCRRCSVHVRICACM